MKDEVLQHALEALEVAKELAIQHKDNGLEYAFHYTLNKIKEALAQPVQPANKDAATIGLAVAKRSGGLCAQQRADTGQPEPWVTASVERIGYAVQAFMSAQPEQEPVAWPPVQFKNVAKGIEVGYDILGGVDIRLGGKFTYVRVNYDHRYTNNAARQVLVDQIVGLLTSPPQRQPEQQLKRVTVADAPNCLNINDKAMWAAGWNDCVVQTYLNTKK